MCSVVDALQCEKAAHTISQPMCEKLKQYTYIRDVKQKKKKKKNETEKSLETLMMMMMMLRVFVSDVWLNRSQTLYSWPTKQINV